MSLQDPQRPNVTAAFTHTERARGTALFGPIVALGIAAAFIAVVAFAAESAVTWVALAAILALGAWWAWGARVSITADAESVRFRAPLYRRTIPRAALIGVVVAADDGMNPGALSWPAVPVQVGETRLIRLNMGGTAAVTCRAETGSGVQLVVRDLATAGRIAGALGA